MIKMGMRIGDRYEMLEKIGTGGMSDVYKAKCHKLNRFVAVKVLKQEFSDNESFVSKFKIEAQAAASLMHPNIVNVYDVGQEDGFYYIVMELVEGITLKNYIEKKARLSVKEAISIAIQVSMGIDSAHNNHIIHRDIKPQNIIISKEGKVKVMDFGIAKAATSNTITSNVMGSVHYTSPEQARGGFSDEKSDIYSLGVTLFEMLTGRVPFNGDTTVAIAIKHIQDDMPSPRIYVPEIPTSVEMIVAKCTQKSPDRRYHSMQELIEDLKKSLMNPDDDFVKIVSPDEESLTKVIDDQDVEVIKRRTNGNNQMGVGYGNKIVRVVEDDNRRPRVAKDKRVKEKVIKEKVKQSRNTRPNKSVKNPRINKTMVDNKGIYSTDSDEEESSKFENLTTIGAIVVAIFIGVILIYLVGRFVGVFGEDSTGLFGAKTISEDMVVVKDVVGNSLELAQSILEEQGFVVDKTYSESDDVDIDVIISTLPKAGESLKKGGKITLVISSGSGGGGVAIPNVVGNSTAEAVKRLEEEGFKVNKVEVYSDQISRGNVVSQSPGEGQKAPRGSTVDISISIGQDSAKKAVPKLIALTEEEAIVRIAENGFTTGTIEQVNHEDPSLVGLVCYQNYSEGSYVEAGTAIDLRISIGPATYNFVGSILGPNEEDASYKPGVDATVVITTSLGVEIYRTVTNSFPLAVDIRGITGTETGTITFLYNVTTEGATTTNENGDTIVTPGTSESKTVSRNVKFARGN